MGELELELAIVRLQQEFRVEIVWGAPNVAYRETITRSIVCGRAEDDVALKLRFEPNGSSSDCTFVDRTSEDTVAKASFVAVQRGLEQRFRVGPIGAGPVVGVAVTLLDATLPPEPNLEAIERVSAQCWQEATRHLAVSILEPIVKVEVETPEEYLGDVIGDLISRRGQVRGMEARGTFQVLMALVPLCNLFGYVNALKRFTEGRARFTMAFDHYEQVPKTAR